MIEEKLSIQALRRRLTQLSRSLRRSTISLSADLTMPQSVGDDRVFFEQSILCRKRIVLLAPRCVTATCTMCPLPNEAIDPKRQTITSDNLIRQFEASFKEDAIDNYQIITVYNNGNFFSDQEISPEVRQHIYKRIRDSHSSILIVESLPQFISDKKISEAKRYLGNKQLVAAIGLQSSNDLIRELAVNTTCTKPAFEKAFRLLRDNGYSAQVFLMIKPPFLTENEAIIDAVSSIQYLSSLGIDDPVLCATRIAPNTTLKLIYDTCRFRTPWLWSILEILRASVARNKKSMPRVAIAELRKEKNPDSICAQNCAECDKAVIDAIEDFNTTRNFSLLNSLHCDCYWQYKKFLIEEEATWGNVGICERVGNFLNRLNQPNLSAQRG